MPIQGNLATMPAAELLMWISRGRKTGTLELRTSRTTETMAFEGGELILSSSSDPEATLGRLLIDRGVLTEEMHSRARDLRETKSIAVAKALLELEFLTEEELLRHLREKAEKELFDACESVEGEFRFIESDLPKLDLLPLRIDVSHMIRSR